jgi:hypothetical protein
MARTFELNAIAAAELELVAARLIETERGKLPLPHERGET